jgi:hypothetical protein
MRRSTLYSEEIMKHEYHEGKEAADKVEKLWTQLFRAPKSTLKSIQNPDRNQI